jgi:hypothetical protein
MRSGVPVWIGLIFWLLLAVPARSAELRPFTSDGCSAFPDGTPFQQQLWLSCCNIHDLAYWRGGTQAERLAADLALSNCVAAAGEPEVAAVMLAGVRVGGAPWLPTPFHWGYGWSDNRGYQPLTARELAIVEKMLKRDGQ